MRRIKVYRVTMIAETEIWVPTTSRRIARLEALRVTDDQPIFPGWKVRRCVVHHRKREEPPVDWLTPKRMA